ncbi:MAG: hypothetical protein XD95_0048 [Microgenomates bacterium 39_7]|nr:MAG: hypothetical protein XD95_0048 [Microgenomates bacterium 39_7]
MAISGASPRTLKAFDRSALSKESSLEDIAGFLQLIISHDFENPLLKFPGQFIWSPANQNEFVVVLSESEISNRYQAGAPNYNEVLFVSDFFAILNDIDSYLQQELERAATSIEEDVEDTNLKNLAKEGLTEISKKLQATTASNRARVGRWSNNTIDLSSEIALFNTVENQQFQSIISIAQSLSDVADDLNIWLRMYRNVVSYKPLAEEQDGSVEPSDNIATASSASKSEQQDGGTDQEPSEPETTEPKPEPDPAKESVNPTPTEFNSALANFSYSFSQVVLNNLLAAYTLDENNKPMAEFSDLSPELQNELRRQLAPQIENIILSLSQSQLEALLHGGPNASAIRLEVFRKAHSFAISYPPLRLLIQQAINETHASLSQAQPEKKDKLTEKIKETSHEAARENLEIVASKDASPIDRDQKIALNTLLVFSSLSPEQLRQEFGSQLKLLSGGKVDDTALGLAQANFESTITSLIISDPILTPKFIDYLDYPKVRAFLGDTISKQVYTDNRQAIHALLKQYWIMMRAELNQAYPSLEKLSEFSPHQIKLSDEEVNDRMHRASLIRADVVRKFDTNKKDVIGVATGGEVEDLDNSEGAKYVRHLKENFLKTADVSQRRRYLESVGLGDQAQQLAEAQTKTGSKKEYEISVKEFNDILHQAQQEFDYFLFVEQELRYQQQLAVQSFIVAQAAQQAARQQFATIALQAQYLDILEGSYFLVPQENYSYQLAGESQPTQIPYYPQSTADMIAMSQGLGDGGGGNNSRGAIDQQKMAMLEGLAEMGVDAALNYATGGAYQAVPKPLRDMLNKIVVKESLKKIRTILKAIKAAALAAVALLAALVKLAHTAITAAGALGGTLVGGGIGLAAGGPVGGAIGAAVGGLAGFFTGKGATNSALSATASQSAQAGARNVSAAAEGLGEAAKQQASLGSMSPEAAMSESAIGANVASQVAAYTVAGMGGLAAATLLVMTVFQSAFLVDVPLTPAELDRMGISQYVQVKKEARIINESSGCAGERRCENPSFPAMVQYVITIEPKNNYILELTFIEDNAKTLYNKDAYPSPGDIPSTPPHNEVFLSGADESIVLNPIDDDQSNNQHTIIYEREYGQNYNHALIKNAVTVKFIYSKDGAQGTNESRSSTSIALGDAPQELLCWPNDGYITSVPFRGIASHINTDAYDIATGSKVVPAYAPTDGTLCGGGLGSNPRIGYGYHVTLSTSILGEDYLFVLGHLDEPSFLVPRSGDCTEVNRGDPIGFVGNTGNSTGHHMHFEKRKVPAGSLSLTELLTGDTAILNYGQKIHSCASEQ